MYIDITAQTHIRGGNDYKFHVKEVMKQAVIEAMAKLFEEGWIDNPSHSIKVEIRS